MDVRCEKIRDTFLQFAVKYAEQAQIDFAIMHCKRGTPYPREETKVHWKGLGRLARVRHLLGRRRRSAAGSPPLLLFANFATQLSSLGSIPMHSQTVPTCIFYILPSINCLLFACTPMYVQVLEGGTYTYMSENTNFPHCHCQLSQCTVLHACIHKQYFALPNRYGCK